MVFSSLLFLILFLPFTFIIYHILPRFLKNIFLLIMSFIFYAWGEPSHIILMIITTLYMWGIGLGIENFKKKQKKKEAKVLLICGIVLSLTTLAYYKYFGFIIENIGFLKYSKVSELAPVLPIGISFYTFQALSYAIDVYRGDVKAQRSWINFAMYISFFSQLIAGPIVRYIDIEKQIEKRIITFKKLVYGVRRFCIGLGKKVIIANQVGALWNELVVKEDMTMTGSWIGVIAYALQIYYDFSGYSDMAIGLGSMFGFDFPENFVYPYQAKSITEFWRRWHITLGTWFREYVYIPLGGNRVGKARLIFNLFIVWTLTGLWHGAAWQFLLWGVYYCVFLIIEKMCLIKHMDRWPVFFRHVYSLVVILGGWVLFFAEDLASVGVYYRSMLGIGTSIISKIDLFLLSEYIILLLIACVGATSIPKQLYTRFTSYLIDKSSDKKRLFYGCIQGAFILAILWISIAFLMKDSYNPFLYFRF